MNECKFPARRVQRNDLTDTQLQCRGVSERRRPGLEHWTLCLVTAGVISMLDMAPAYASVSGDVATLTFPAQQERGQVFVDSLERQRIWPVARASHALWQQGGSQAPRKPIGCCSPP